jgi:endoglucanase
MEVLIMPNRRRVIRRIVLLAGLLFGLLLAPQSAASEVAPERLDRLARGINLSHWFSQVHPAEAYTLEHLRSHTSAADLDAIAAAGFGHVRLPIDPLRFLEDDDPGRIRADWLDELDRAIGMLLERDLAVIVDLHAFGPFIGRLQDHDDQIGQVERLWTALCARLVQHDPDRVFIELMNEPKLNDAARWQLIAGRLHAAVRAAAPAHTIVLSGKHYSGAGDLAVLEPVADPNVVYNFHCYDPMIFTHQAATWTWWPWKHCTDVPYPSDPETVQTAVETAGHDRSKGLLREYGEQRWDRARLAAVVDQAADWGRRHGVAITCNEFGVYTKAAPRESRLRWIADAVAIFEQRDIGWSMWDYQGGFSLKDEAASSAEAVVLDQELLAAMGLLPAK